MCKYVVTTVDRLLEDEDDVEAIKESLEKACKVMYNQVRSLTQVTLSSFSTTDSFVEQHSSYAEFLIQHFGPN